MTRLEKVNGRYTGTAFFVRKAYDLNCLLDLRTSYEKQNKKGQPFVIEKIIDLNIHEYEWFCMELLNDQGFIIESSKLMKVDENGVWHCILVRAEPLDSENMAGILVNAEGYDYPRYSAALGNAGNGVGI